MADGLPEELEMVRRQVRRFVDTELIPLESQGVLGEDTKARAARGGQGGRAVAGGNPRGARRVAAWT